jgi:hypothetical protein
MKKLAVSIVLLLLLVPMVSGYSIFNNHMSGINRYGLFNLTWVNSTSFCTGTPLSCIDAWTDISAGSADGFWNITGSKYLYNASRILAVNESRLNATITAITDARDSTNTTAQINTAINVSGNRYAFSSVATSDSSWTLHNSYPAACGAGTYATAIGDTLTCTADRVNTTAQIIAVVNNTHIDTTGNAATASLLGANPPNCAANTYPLGINASGGVESCSTDRTNTTLQMRAAVNNTHIDTTGTAALASLLAANPPNCAAGSYPLGINASGGVESCGVPPTNTSAQVRAAINVSGLRFVSSAVATSDSDWTAHNSYPAACAAGTWATTIGDTLTCTADRVNTTAQVVSAVNNSAYRFVFKVPRSSVVQNWAACPAGSAQISDNETGRYCDATMMNTTEVSALYVQKAAPVMTKNVSFNGGESDFFLYFYEDGSSTQEYITWNNAADMFIASDAFRTLAEVSADGYVKATGNLYTDADIYSTGSGDDFWLGNSTRGSSLLRANANGTMFIKHKVELNSSATSMKSNTTCIKFQTPTANMTIGC